MGPLMRPITVAQVIPRMRSGGAELGCLQVAEALVKAGHRAIVVSAGGRMVDELRAVGAVHVEMPVAAKNPVSLALNARRLAALVKNERVDILHARSRAPAWSTLAAARQTNTAFVTTYHSEYSERGRIKNAYNSVMARSDTVIAVSHHMAMLIRARYKTPETRITVIPRAFDPAKFDAALITPDRLAAVRAQFGAGPDDTIALLAGRITRRKAQDHFVEALGLMKQQGQALPLAVLAGEVEKDDFKVELLARATALGVIDRIRIPGFVSDMAAAYTTASVLLNISAFEGLPRVALEAQAMGCPVIVSDTGPGREVALTSPDTPKSAATGLRVPFADPPRLAEAVAEILGDEPARQAMGARAAAHVRATYTLDRLTSSTLQVYETVLARRGTL
jgi:glycosyltransferase involved in cell wall biosynthesis